MWEASEQQISTLANLHTDLVKEFGSAGSGFAGGNAKLQDYIASLLITNSISIFNSLFFFSSKPATVSQTERIPHQRSIRKYGSDHYARGCRLFCVLCGCIAGMVRATGKVVGEALEMVSDPTYFSRPVLFTDRADL